MVIAPELLPYYASMPISRLEEEVARITAAMYAADRANAVPQHTLRPTGRLTDYTQSLPRTDYQSVAAQQARQDDVYGKLYYEDMPLHYRGYMLRDAQEVLPFVNGRSDDDTHQL